MNLLELMVKVGVDDQATSKIGAITDKLGSAAGGLAKAGTALAGATAAGTVAVAGMGKEALDAYANFEQLSGGVAKLYGNAGMSVEKYAESVHKSVDEVQADYERNEAAQAALMEHAQEAYKTAGMSANAYMEQATNFSAALINSLGGDTEKAAEQTDKAMQLMADNVNTFGSDAEAVQNAIQGLSRENYTMLDNLKLGYAGTKEGMQQLIADANEYAASIDQAGDLEMGNFSDMIDAIDLIQQKQGIAGTTAREAATTIEGSINMTKAAWSNLLAEFGKEDGDVGARVTELVDSAKTALLGSVDEVTGELQGGIIPRFKQIVQSIVDALPEAIPMLLEVGKEVFGAIVEAVVAIAPSVLDALVQMLTDIADFIVENKEAVVEGALDMISGLLDAIIELTPVILEMLVALLVELAMKLVEHAPEFLAKAGEMALAILKGIAMGLEPLMDTVNEAIEGALDAIGSFFQDMWNAGAELMSGLIDGILDGLGPLGDALSDVGDFIVQHKGPPEKDRVMLRGNGRLIMGGLVDSIVGEIPALERAIGKVNGVIRVDANPSASLNGTGGANGQGIVFNIIVQAREGEDYEELGRRIGYSASLALKEQGVVA